MTEINWDRNFALEQAGGDEEILAELIELFKQSSATDLAKMKAGAAAQDPMAIGDAAHSVKGAAASLGVEAVRVLAHEVERAGRNGDLPGALVHLPALEQLLTHLDAMR